MFPEVFVKLSKLTEPQKMFNLKKWIVIKLKIKMKIALKQTAWG